MPSNLANLVGFNATIQALEGLQESVDSDTVYVVAPEAEYAVHLEFGTENMPPYPFVRPAVEEFRNKPDSFLQKHTGGGLEDVGSADELVTKLAMAMERQISDNATAAGSGRSPGVHPEHPQRVSGHLAGSITAEEV